MNPRMLSQAVSAILNPDYDPDAAPAYPDFRTAFEATFAAARTECAAKLAREMPNARLVTFAEMVDEGSGRR